jgi:hypothetical protein
MLAVLTGLAVAACSGSPAPTQPETITLPLVSDAGQHGGVPHNHRAHLSGENEILNVPAGSPTPADSNAQGQAIIQIAPDGKSFSYKLIASNIENVIMAHIHCGPSTANGPIIVWLYPNPDAPGPVDSGAGRHDGVLAENVVREDDPDHVREVPTTHAVCTGGVQSFDDVLAKIRAGQAYVNVHTNDGVGDPNTGPGDFPGGEIRGQLR